MTISTTERVRRAELFTQGLKLCLKCRKELPLDQFARARTTNDGLQKWCNPCLREYRRTDAYRERTRLRSLTPERQEYERQRGFRRTDSLTPEARAQRRDTKFGLRPGEYEAMTQWRTGCHNCGSLEAGGKHGTWHVDHDHQCCPGVTACGKCIRGLLCNSCNVNEIRGVELAVEAGRLLPEHHPYLADNWTHHRDEFRA